MCLWLWCRVSCFLNDTGRCPLAALADLDSNTLTTVSRQVGHKVYNNVPELLPVGSGWVGLKRGTDMVGPVNLKRSFPGPQVANFFLQPSSCRIPYHLPAYAPIVQTESEDIFLQQSGRGWNMIKISVRQFSSVPLPGVSYYYNIGFHSSCARVTCCRRTWTYG